MNNTLSKYGIFIFILCSVIIIGLGLSILFDEYTDRKRKRIIMIVVAIIFSLIIQNYIEFTLIQIISRPYLRTLVAIYGYIVRPIIILLYIYIINPDKSHLVEWLAIGINSVIYLSATFTDIAFAISDDNTYIRGPLGHFSLIVSGFLLIYLFYLVIVELVKNRKKETLIPVFLIAVIMLSEFADIKYNVKEQVFDYITIGTLIVTIFFYIWLHLEFVRSHEKNLIAEQRIQLMLSQIQPHFIYNSLSTISEMCEIDPNKAQQLTNDFSEYLRYNFSALTEETLVPFTKQMEQVRFYLNIEKARFQERLNIVYDIKATSFELPNLTLQPIVENAVKHGICRREEGGTVTIRSYENDVSYIIDIIDDGVGFDPDAKKNDNRQHVGIQNVRERLSYYKNKMIIRSEEQKGTVVTIIVPKI